MPVSFSTKIAHAKLTYKTLHPRQNGGLCAQQNVFILFLCVIDIIPPRDGLRFFGDKGVSFNRLKADYMRAGNRLLTNVDINTGF